MPRGRRKSSISCNQYRSEFLGQYEVGSVVSRKIVTKLPDSRHEHAVRISGETEVQQVANGLVNTLNRNQSLQCESPQHLRDLKIKKVGRVQGLISQIDSLLDVLPR